MSKNGETQKSVYAGEANSAEILIGRKENRGKKFIVVQTTRRVRQKSDGSMRQYRDMQQERREDDNTDKRRMVERRNNKYHYV